MSTFKGLLGDPILNFMAIDHFESHVYGCDTFLLSHHHCDHMQGIFADKFANLLNESTSKLMYCSPVTAHFLRKHYQFSVQSEKVVVLQLNKPLVIRRNDVSTDVVVTCLPAAHCPGSVMFLIEYASRRILYSGDIRITLDDVRKIQGTLTNSDGSVIKIDDLYLDTTFARPTAFEDIPLRDSSEQTIIHLAREFLSKSSNHKVALRLSARFGYESLYLNLHNHLNKPIMVHKDDYKYYKSIEEMKNCVISESTSFQDDWSLHACLHNRCPLTLAKNVKVLKPCALLFVRATPAEMHRFETYKKLNVPYLDDNSGVTRVLYSTHCSLNELRDLYRFLKPTKLIPSVRQGDVSIKEILDLIINEDGKASSGSKKCGMVAKISTNELSREEIWAQRAERRRRLKLDNDSDDEEED